MQGTASRREVVLKGLWWEVKTYNEFSGDILFSGDIRYGEREFKNIPILRLTIELADYGYSGEEDSPQTEIFIMDDFSNLIPYLKPVKGFRDTLETSLKIIIENQSPAVIKAGAEKYLEEIRTFSYLKSLVRQAKECVNLLKPERKGAEKAARAIMEAMNVTPQTDLAFRNETT